MSSQTDRPSTEAEALTAIKILGAAFPLFAQHTTDEDTRKVWVKLFCGLTVDELHQGVKRIGEKHNAPNITTAEFMAVVRQAREDIAAQMPKLPKPDIARPEVAALYRRWLGIMIRAKVSPPATDVELHEIRARTAYLKQHTTGDGSSFKPSRELQDETSRVLMEAHQAGVEIHNGGGLSALVGGGSG